MSVYNTYSERFNQKKTTNKQNNQEQQGYSFIHRGGSVDSKSPLKSEREYHLKSMEENQERLQQIIFEQNKNDRTYQELQCCIQDHEEKFENITKLIKLLQQFAESQEEENKGLKQTMKQLFNQRQFQLDLFNNKQQNPDIMFGILEKMENQQNNIQAQFEELQRQQIEFENNNDNNFKDFQKEVNTKVNSLTHDLAADIKTIENAVNNEDGTVNTDISSLINQKFDELRNEMNQKIDIVMSEVKQSALQQDVVDNSRKIFKINKSVNEFRDVLQAKYPKSMSRITSPSNNHQKRSVSRKSSNNSLSRSKSPKSSIYEHHKPYFTSPNNQELVSYQQAETRRRKSTARSVSNNKIKKDLKDLMTELSTIHEKIDKIKNQQKVQKKRISSMLNLEEFDQFKKNILEKQSAIVYANVVERFNELLETSNNLGTRQSLQQKLNDNPFSNQTVEEAMESFGVSSKHAPYFSRQYQSEPNFGEPQNKSKSQKKRVSVLKKSDSNKENQLKNSNVAFKHQQQSVEDDEEYYDQHFRSTKPKYQHNKSPLIKRKKSKSNSKRNSSKIKRNSSKNQQMDSHYQSYMSNSKHQNDKHYQNQTFTSIASSERGRKVYKRELDQLDVIMNSMDRSRSKSHRSCETCRTLSQNQKRSCSRSKSAKTQKSILMNTYSNLARTSKNVTPKNRSKIFKDDRSPMNKSQKKQRSQQLPVSSKKKSSSIFADKRDKEEKIKQLLKKRRENQGSKVKSDKSQKLKPKKML